MIEEKIEKDICPGCGRHCDLSEPHCGRGEEYRRTGKMPEQRNEKECHQGKMHRREMHRAHYETADINDKLIINLRDLGHMMRFLYEGKASQKRILIILNESDTITQRDLTERLGIQPGSASEVLSKLESAGLIVRTQNETDRRTTDVSLTDTGRELAAEALAQRQQRHEKMFSCVSEEEKQQLLSLLERICTDWRRRYCEDGHHGGHGHHGEDGHHGGHGHHGEHGHYEGRNDGEHGHHDSHGRYHTEPRGHQGGSHAQGGN